MTKSKETELRELVAKKFSCIQGDCDGNGNIPVLVARIRQISETECEQYQELEAEQCQFHAQYIFPFADMLVEQVSLALEEKVKAVEKIASTCCVCNKYRANISGECQCAYKDKSSGLLRRSTVIKILKQ